MKLFNSILFLTILLWQLAFAIGVLGYWKMNQSSITKLLCENKEKPQLHCNGKCYLNKQLKKTEQKETSTASIPLTILKLKSLEYFLWSIEAVIGKRRILYSINILAGRHSFDLSPGHCFSLLQPPDLN